METETKKNCWCTLLLSSAVCSYKIYRYTINKCLSKSSKCHEVPSALSCSQESVICLKLLAFTDNSCPIFSMYRVLEKSVSQDSKQEASSLFQTWKRTLVFFFFFQGRCRWKVRECFVTFLKVTQLDKELHVPVWVTPNLHHRWR